MKNLRKNKATTKRQKIMDTIELTSENAMIQERNLGIECHHTSQRKKRQI